MIKDIFMDAGADTLRMVPFLLGAFLLIEALEHYSTEYTGKFLKKVGSMGPAAGAAAGCVPQCGFSVMAANLYAGGIISAGTLLSVFISTSDEAVLIILGSPGQERKLLPLLAVKVITAVAAGYAVDLLLGKYIAADKESGGLCEHCGCGKHNAGIVKPAFYHTIRISLYLFLFTGALNLCIQLVGMERISGYLLGDTWLQPVIAAAVGLIPNCAASVILTELYLSGVVSFAGAAAGLCTAAGVGMAVLFKVNHNKIENLKLLGILYVTGVIAGMAVSIIE